MTTVGPTPTAGNDLYEAYLFGLLLQAAVNVGYAVEIRRTDGTQASALHLRRSPGRIASLNHPGPQFTHAVLSIGQRPDMELHTGVTIVGKSKVVHEADVLLLPSSVAARCRTAGIDPPSNTASLVIEAKYWTQAVTLRTGREFLGLRKDLSAKQMLFVATVANDAAISLLAGTPSVDYNTGVLPNLTAEPRLRAFMERILIAYRDRR